MSRRTGFVAAASAIALIAAAVAVFKLGLLQTVDVERGVLAPEDTADVAPRRPAPPKLSWPMFRFDPQRTGFNPRARARPPFRVRWKKPNLGVNEVPPALDRGILVGATYSTKRSEVYARSALTGKLLWRKRYNRGLNFAGGPAIARGRAYVPAHDGYMRVFNIRTGKVVWRFKARPHESPPIVSDGVLYFGDGENGAGEMYAIDVRTRKVLWRFRAQNHVSSGAALTRSTVYFGSLDGSVYALDRESGKLRWRAHATDALGRAAAFFATPAIAKRLVVVGSFDGNVYAFDARTGEQRWRHEGEQGEVYASAAVDGQNAYVGGYGGTFSALDLDTGRPRWTIRPGPNIGSPTVLAGAVYFSTLTPRATYAHSTRTGRRLWSFRDGKYTPIIADRRAVWLVGANHIYRLESKRRRARSAGGDGRRSRSAGGKRAGPPRRAKARR